MLCTRIHIADRIQYGKFDQIYVHMDVNYRDSLIILLTTFLLPIECRIPRRTTIVYFINIDYLSRDSYCEQLVYNPET